MHNHGITEPTFFRDDLITRLNGNKLVRGDYFSRPSIIQARVVIQGLFRGEKFSRWQGPRKPRENFSHAVNSWFTVPLYACILCNIINSDLDLEKKPINFIKSTTPSPFDAIIRGPGGVQISKYIFSLKQNVYVAIVWL